MELAALRRALEAKARPELAKSMEAYQRDQFRFFGIKSKPRRDAQKPFLLAHQKVSAHQVLRSAERCFREPERELQYVAVDLLRRYAKKLEPKHLTRVKKLVQTKSWWDTVDALAAHVVGGIIKQHREHAAQMDEWIRDDDLWVARTALLHQLTYKGETDTERLFRYCDQQAEHPDFFMRKAIGWALRQYAHHDPEPVRAFVEERGETLSGLSQREALKHIRKG